MQALLKYGFLVFLFLSASSAFAGACDELYASCCPCPNGSQPPIDPSTGQAYPGCPQFLTYDTVYYHPTSRAIGGTATTPPVYMFQKLQTVYCNANPLLPPSQKYMGDCAFGAVRNIPPGSYCNRNRNSTAPCPSGSNPVMLPGPPRCPAATARIAASVKVSTTGGPGGGCLAPAGNWASSVQVNTLTAPTAYDVETCNVMSGVGSPASCKLTYDTWSTTSLKFVQSTQYLTLNSSKYSELFTSLTCPVNPKGCIAAKDCPTPHVYIYHLDCTDQYGQEAGSDAYVYCTVR